jgi:hypothetical protein
MACQLTTNGEQFTVGGWNFIGGIYWLVARGLQMLSEKCEPSTVGYLLSAVS